VLVGLFIPHPTKVDLITVERENRGNRNASFLSFLLLSEESEEWFGEKGIVAVERTVRAIMAVQWSCYLTGGMYFPSFNGHCQSTELQILYWRKERKQI